MNNAKTIALFKRAILGSKLNAGYHAKRICSCGIDSLSLVDPVKLHGQGVGVFVKSNRSNREVLIENLKLADIYDEVIVEVNNRSNLSKYAYTLRKLEKEAPSIGVFHIRTGKHIDKIGKLRRNGDLSHINCEDVRCNHILVEVKRTISNVINRLGVGDVTEPSELTVTAGCHAEVEGVLTLLVHVKSNGTGYALVVHKANSYLNNLYAGCLVTCEYVAVNGAVSRVFKNQLVVAFLNSNRLVVIACRYGKNSVRAVNRIHMRPGEVNVLGNNNVHLGCTNNLITKHHAIMSQKQKCRPMEQDEKLKDKPKHLWAPYHQQRRQEYIIGQR